MAIKTIKYFLIYLLLFAGNSFAQKNRNLVCKNSESSLPYQNVKLNPDFEKYDVVNYELNLEINPDIRFIDGYVKILFEALENNVSDLIINLNGLQIDSIVQRNNKLSFNRRQNEVIITLPQPMFTGILDSLIIHYNGIPNRGMYFRDGKYNNRVVYTHNEPFDAQYWIPCKDDPSDKALLDVLVTVPQNYTVASNGLLLNSISIGSDRIRYHWKETYFLSTYLISVTVSEFDIVNDVFNWNLSEMPVQYFIYPEDYGRGEAAITNTIEMLDFFSNYIGTYPFILEKYAMVEAPFQEAGAMENQTISLMDEPIIDNESVIAHELAHQWWGDAVTLASFADIWLNEGFATYFDALFVEHKYGENAFLQRMISSSSNANNDGSINYPIYDPPSGYLFGSAVYHKGAWVLHMLRNELGEDIFQSIIQTYYGDYIYGNVSTAEFIGLCENISGESLTKFFDQWVYTAGVPNIYATWFQENSNVNIQLEQLQTETIYDLNLELKLIGLTTDSTIVIDFDSRNYEYNVSYSEPITQLIIDPETKILNLNNSPVYSIPTTTELIRLYPNPFNSELNIYYKVDKFQNIKIELWNILGEKLLTLFDGKKQIGTYNFTYSAAGIASGTYICVLKSKTNLDSRKVVLIK